MRARKIFAAISAASVLTAATGPIRLQPSGPWMLGFTEASCRLTRTFGEGKNKTTLYVESSAPDNVSMVAIGNPLSRSGADVLVATRFLPLQEKGFVGRAAHLTATAEPAVLWSAVVLAQDSDDEATPETQNRRLEPESVPRPPPLDRVERAKKKAERQAFASKTRAIEIVTRPDQPVILDTGSLVNAIKMLDQCVLEQLPSWGIDPELEEKIVRPVWTPSAQKWFSSHDYPSAMLVSLKESEVVARLLVDARGRVTRCTALSHVNAPEFQKSVCNALKSRGRFDPAELADGTKVPSYTVIRAKFRLWP